jgi:trimeric autotransporter adhesin
MTHDSLRLPSPFGPRFSRARLGLLLATLAVVAAAFAPAVAGAAVPSTSASTYGTDGTVNAITTLGDTVYLGGAFDNIGLDSGGGAATAASDGQADAAMPAVTGNVQVAVADGSGGFYIGGSFSRVGGVARANLAHILPDKNVDPSFNPVTNGTVRALALSGSTLYVGGDFSGGGSIAGADRNLIAALDTTTGHATSWDPNVAGSQVSELAVSGSVVYAGGFFNTVGGQTRHNIAAIDTTSGNATGWDPDANGAVRALAVDGSTVYVGGNFSGTSSIGGADREHIAALNDSTGAATSWDPNANAFVDTLAVDGSTIYAGGGFTSIGGQTRHRIAALDANTDTNNATSWDPDAQGFVTELAVDGSTVYVAGAFNGPNSIGGADRNRLAALDTGTGSATGWDPNVSDQAFALAVDGSTVYVGGIFSLINQQPRSNLAAIDAATETPTSWDPSANGPVYALTTWNVQQTVYVGGSFSSVGGQVRSNIAAIDADTGDATSWDANANGTVLTLLRTGAILYAGGDFSGTGSIGGADRNYIAALQLFTDTNNATSWDANANGTVRTLAASDDLSIIYAGGDFAGASSIGGQTRNHIAALSGSNGSAFNWDPNANGVVRALAVSGSTVYAGGDFSGAGSIGGADRNHIAAFDGNGNAPGNATSWDPDANGNVEALAVDGSTVYVGGDFGSIGGQSRNRIAGLDAGTGNATSWDPNAFGAVLALNAGPGVVYAGGSFDGVGSGPAAHFAAFIEAPANTALPSISGTPQVGETLNCDTGTWSGATPQTYSYEWLQDNAPIGGETSSDYQVRQADIGHSIRCRVTAENLGGQSSAMSDPVTISVRRAERIFWANYGADSLSYADLDGSGHGEDLDTGATAVNNPSATALDPAAGRIYWANSSGVDTINYANLDGTGGGGTLNISDASVNGIRGMVLDHAAGKIYWANEGSDTISFANLDGSGSGDLSTSGATVTAPAGVAIDKSAGRIYWANDGSNAHPISYANLNGSGSGADLDTSGATASLAIGPTLDLGAGKVYWGNKGLFTISFANLDGTGGGGELDITGATSNGPFGTAMDSAAGQIYWPNYDGTEISGAGLDGSGGSDLDTTGATVSNPLFPSLLQQPANTAIPAVSGTPAAGHNLSCSNGTWGADKVGELLYRAPESFDYQWLKDNAPISGQTTSTYAVTPGDPGHQIKCRVTASNFGGQTNATSAATAIKTKPANTALPTISGTPVSGKTLTCNKGTWTGSAPITYSYRWLRNNVAITGATASTYVVKTADVGKQLKCRVTANNAAGSTMATSAAVTVKTPPRNTVAPKVTGTPKVGKTLTCAKGTWTGSAPITYKYQWLRNGAPIAGVTNATYVAKAADQNKFLSCKVTATNAAGSAFKTSAAVKVT